MTVGADQSGNDRLSCGANTLGASGYLDLSSHCLNSTVPNQQRCIFNSRFARAINHARADPRLHAGRGGGIRLLCQSAGDLQRKEKEDGTNNCLNQN